jgi:arsenate reductase
MTKLKVLFVCIHNSARSQIAEELLRKIAGDRFEPESAGIDPGKLNPAVVEVLKEEGIDISAKKTRAVADLLQQKRLFSYVITVCDETSAERCPVFPGQTKRLHWGFEDPSAFKGEGPERLARTRAIRDQIRTRIEKALATGELAQ